MRSRTCILRISFYGSLLLVLTGCQKSLPKEEYMQWMRDEKNGLLKKKEIGDYIFEVQYKSPEMILLTLKGNKMDEAKVNELNQMQYFDLKIKHKGGQDFIKTGSSDQTEYYNRLNYFSFGFQNDIKMQEKEAIYSCALFHFERSYGLSASRIFALGFEMPIKEKQDDKTLTIDAHELGVGLVKIKFKKEDIDNIPSLIP